MVNPKGLNPEPVVTDDTRVENVDSAPVIGLALPDKPKDPAPRLVNPSFVFAAPSCKA